MGYDYFTPARMFGVAGLRSGKYYVPGFSNFATLSMTVNRLYATPFWVPRRTAIDRIGLGVSGAGGAGSIIRLGVYQDIQDGVGGYPGDLIFEAGSTVDGTSATAQEITVSQTLPAGIVWLAAVAQVGTSPTVRALTGNQGFLIPSGALPNNTNQTGVASSGVSGALPSTFGAQFDTGDGSPRVSFRVA